MEHLFDELVDIYKLKKDTDESPADTEEYGLAYANVPCQIQALSDSYGEDFSGTYGKDFLMFCKIEGIQELDKIKHDGKYYIVAGVEEYDLLGKFHSEVRIRLLD